MATLVLRNVEPELHARLKAHAADHRRWMEEEAWIILRERLATTATSPSVNWVDAIRALFDPLGGVGLPEIPRGPAREPPDFSEPDHAPA